MNYRRGARITLLGQWGRYAIVLIGLVVISRLLPPSDVGLVALALVVTGLASLVADFGLMLAAIQSKSLSRSEHNSLFWANSAIGLLATIVVLVVSPFAASFYRDPRVGEVLAWLSLTLVISGLGVQARADLTRRMKFTALVWIDLASATLGLLTATVMALTGCGYWSLVGQQVVLALVATVASLVISRQPVRWPDRHTSLRRFFLFGANNFAAQAANFVASNVDTVALGRFASTAVVGLYSRAFQLLLIPVQQILTPLTRVMIPRLARATDDPIEFQELTLRLQRVISTTSGAALSAMAAVAPAALAVFFGDQWVGAAPLLRILCVASLFQISSYIYYWALVAHGRTGILAVSELPGRVVMILLAFPAAAAGVEWLCAAVAIQQLLIWIAATCWSGRKIGLQTLRVGAQSLPSVAVYTASFCAAISVETFLLPGDWPPVAVLVLQSVSWLAVVALAVSFFPTYRRNLSETVALLRR